MQALRPSVSAAVGLAPGIALSAVVAAIGYVTAPYVLCPDPEHGDRACRWDSA